MGITVINTDFPFAGGEGAFKTYKNVKRGSRSPQNDEIGCTHFLNGPLYNYKKAVHLTTERSSPVKSGKSEEHDCNSFPSHCAMFLSMSFTSEKIKKSS